MAFRTITFLQFFLYISSIHSFPFSFLNLKHINTRDLSAVANELGTLGSDLTDPSTLKTFLGNKGNVITQNDVLDSNGSCATMTVLFARGTGEVGNVGVLTGPPFFTALAAYMNQTGSMAIQGVDYAATVSGFLAGGDPAGAKTMASLINNTLTTCPNTHLTVSGYSQGAQLVHLAMSSLSGTIASRIKSVVMFGDPMNGTALNGVDASRVMTFCNPKDDICKGRDVILPAHLEYSAYAGTAAMFALSGLADVGITSARKVSGVGGIMS
ncbi:5d45b6cf-7af5-47d5-894b-eeb7a18ef65f [Sclerotinia trifoliorum]|uniref:Cutinase n=1 Tax=Sclerotinia trifoliorum TaxID=28548 RepID=A0A8H2ZNP0_9HELO|nr:5d45b6cf-7af5-47d5-894b-eeb7a18ef65f [Sclerotinia trifoliorum]